MNILLVYPETPDTFWSFRHSLKFLSKKSILPPLGLLTVASMLPEAWNQKLVDMSVEALADEDIAQADYVFISAMAIQLKSARKVVERCKALHSRTVAGGPLITSAPELFDDVDHLVLNEAEITLPRFLEDLKSGRAQHIYRSSDRARISRTPVPSWHLIDMRKYALMPIQYSRGCPFACDFCDVTVLFGNKMRTKPSDLLISELQSLYEHGWKGAVFIVDDNFIGNKRQVKAEVLPRIIEWSQARDHPFTFLTQASINLADDEKLMDLMTRAGFDTVFIGIETPEDVNLSECGKSQNRNRDLIDSVKKIQRSGMQVQGGFILGFDNEQPSIFDQIIGFIQESGIVTAMVGLLNAPRGTRLYERLAAEDRLLNDSTGDNTDASINFVPKMGLEDLVCGYRRVVDTLYCSEHYHRRIITFLKNYQPLRNHRRRLSLTDLKTMCRTSWHLGVVGQDRYWYWRLVLWTLFKKPQQLETAITLAVHGFHFRKISSQNRVSSAQ